jgi:hypothetical protein
MIAEPGDAVRLRVCLKLSREDGLRCGWLALSAALDSSRLLSTEVSRDGFLKNTEPGWAGFCLTRDRRLSGAPACFPHCLNSTSPLL